MNPNKKRKSQNEAFLQKGLSVLAKEDQYDVFGKYVATELRTVSSDYLSKKINRKLQQVILTGGELKGRETFKSCSMYLQ